MLLILWPQVLSIGEIDALGEEVVPPGIKLMYSAPYRLLREGDILQLI